MLLSHKDKLSLQGKIVPVFFCAETQGRIISPIILTLWNLSASSVAPSTVLLSHAWLLLSQSDYCRDELVYLNLLTIDHYVKVPFITLIVMKIAIKERWEISVGANNISNPPFHFQSVVYSDCRSLSGYLGFPRRRNRLRVFWGIVKSGLCLSAWPDIVISCVLNYLDLKNLSMEVTDRDGK